AGSISFLYYADRVMEFPLGIFGIALASAALPAMSRQAAAGDTRALAGTLNFALRLAVYICLPATIGLLVLRAPITRVLFDGGRALLASTLRTAAASAPLAAWCWLALPILAIRRGLALDASLLVATIAVGALVFWLGSAALHSPERGALRRLLPARRGS